MRVLHCWSRDVHWPLAQDRPFPQLLPFGAVWSGGQELELPVQTSCGSHTPVEGLQTVPAVFNWQLRQQSSLASSHTEPDVYLHVVGLQHLSFPQPLVPPQSQSSPTSTMPLPQMGPELRITFLLSVRQVVLTLPVNIALQILPTEHGLKFVMPCAVDGFMMYFSPASQVELLSGQHCCAAYVPSLQVSEVQSWTAPNV